jgi:Flp pilus assembly pilin Flp
MTEPSINQKLDENQTQELRIDFVEDKENLDPVGLETGANLAEYSILVLLLLVIALIAIQSVGREVSSVFSKNASAITEASS